MDWVTNPVQRRGILVWKKPTQDGVYNPVLTFSSKINKTKSPLEVKIITNQTIKTHEFEMPKNRIHQGFEDNLYFITPTIWNWYYIFDRHNRWQIIADSLKFCQETKGLEIYAYVFMLNHLHLIIRSPDAAGFLRDFKKFTSKKLIENIAEFEPQVLELFKTENGYRFWKKDNQPKIIEGEKFLLQKVNYIHNNPVVKGYVERPEYWKWSSANLDSKIKVLGW